jgi:hypothetical protein
MHYTIALLCHDIGYLRKLFPEDKPGEYLTGVGDESVRVPDEGTDAVLTPYHVDRSIRFIRERFGRRTLVDVVDPDVICSYIEMTRFPIPDSPEYKETNSLAGLARAADFIGQLGDPNYLRKIPALYYEFEETGQNQRSGYKSPEHLRQCYTQFYWDIVYPYISDAIEYLSITQEGKLWIANLYAHVHKVEHENH